MANVTDARRLAKRALLANLGIRQDEGISVVPVLSGRMGDGKSATLRQIAKEINGIYMLVDCSQLGDCDILGTPFKVTNPNTGRASVVNAPHIVFSNIQDIEEDIFKRASTVGLLNGRLKVINLEGDISYTPKETDTKFINKYGNGPIIYSKNNQFVDKLNKFKVGSNLPYEIKLELLENGDIRPVVLNFDELNRAEPQTMKQCMNILLNGNITGYELPYWVFICGTMNPGSADSEFNVNELEPAQKDRILKINFETKFEDWADWASSENIDPEILIGLALSNSSAFIDNRACVKDNISMSPSARSWTLVSRIKEYAERLNNTKYFLPKERTFLEDDICVLMDSKVGTDAGRAVRNAYKNKDNIIKPEEIVTGNSDIVDKSVMKKFMSLNMMSQKITADRLVSYLGENTLAFKKSGEKGKFQRIGMQVSDFILNAPPVIQVSSIKSMIRCKTTDLYSAYIEKSPASNIALSILNELSEFQNQQDKINN